MSWLLTNCKSVNFCSQLIIRKLFIWIYFIFLMTTGVRSRIRHHICMCKAMVDYIANHMNVGTFLFCNYTIRNKTRTWGTICSASYSLLLTNITWLPLQLSIILYIQLLYQAHIDNKTSLRFLVFLIQVMVFIIYLLSVMSVFIIVVVYLMVEIKLNYTKPQSCKITIYQRR